MTLDTLGQGVVNVPPSMGGQPIKVVTTGADGKPLPTTTVDVPLLAPQLGAIDPVSAKLPVTGTPGANVQLQDKDGKPVGSPVTLDAQGKGVVNVPPSMGGQPIKVVTTGADGKPLPTTTVDVPLLAPQLGAVDPVSGKLPVTGTPGASVQLQDKDGKPVGSPVTLDTLGQGVIKLTHDAGGESLRVIVEKGGQQSSAAQVETPLLKPVLGPVDALTGQLMLEGKPGATVQIDVPAGTAISVILDQQGKGSAILPSIASLESLEGTLTSGNLVSAPASIAVPVLAPRNGEVNDTGTHVAVNGKPGEIIKVMDAQGVELGSGVAGKDGAIEIALNTPQDSRVDLTLTAYNKGHASPAIVIVAPVIDTERPLPPIDLNINPDGTRVLGKAKVGETARIVNLDTKEDLGTFAVGSDGFFSANIPLQMGGDKLSITLEKGAKTSLPALLLVPYDWDQFPAKPFDLSIDVTGTTVQGKGVPNTIALVKSEDNQTEIAKGLVGPDGAFELRIALQPGGQRLNVALQNKDKVSDSATVIAPYIDSNTPTGMSINEAGTQVTGKGKAGDTVRVKDAQDNEIGSGVVGPDGTFVATIAKQPAGQSLAVTAQGQGVESAPAYVQTLAFDIARPTQPDARIDASATRISGKAEPGASVSVKDAAGNLLAGPVLAEADGTFTAQIAQLAAGTPVKVVAEVAGKESLPGELIVPLVAGAVPPPPLSASISADGKSVFGKAAPNSTIEVKDTKGNKLGEQRVGDDGSYDVPIEVQVGGTTLYVLTAAMAGESSQVPVLAPFQLTAQTQEAHVGLFIDPYLNELTNTVRTIIDNPISTSVGDIADNVSEFFGKKPRSASEVTKEFSVAENERVQVKISDNTRFNADFGRISNVTIEKQVGDKWINVNERGPKGELANLVGKGIKSDMDKSSISFTYETPGDYRITIYDESVLSVGDKKYAITFTKEPFAGGFANNAIISSLILSPGAKLLKVNDKTLANDTYTAIRNKHGELHIRTDGRASYVQDQDASPSNQPETFTYEALEASGAIRSSSFTITPTPPAISGDLLSQDDASITSVNNTPLPENDEHTINSKFGDLKIKADGQYTYTPKLSLAGLNETDTFEYVVRHKSGETVTSTLNVHIADARLVAELETVSPVTDLSINPDGTRVLGKAKVGETVKIVNLDTLEVLGTFATGPDGFFSANIPLQAGGGRLSVTAENAVKTSLPALLLVPLDGEQIPAKPFDLCIDATGTKVQGKGTPYTIALIKSADNQTVIAKGLVGPDGAFQLSIAPQPVGRLLNVVLQNKDKVSDSATVITSYIDANTPTEVSINKSGTQVTGKAKAGDTIRVKDAQDNEIGSGVVGPDGTFVATIAKQPAGQSLTVTAQGQGVESAPAYVQTLALDVARPPQPDALVEGAAPPVALSASISADGKSVFGKAAPNSTVVVTDAKGNELGEQRVGDDGSYDVPIEVQMGGTTLHVFSLSMDKQSPLSPQTSVLAPFQLAAQTQEVQVGLFIDPGINKLTKTETAPIDVPLSSVISKLADKVTDHLGKESWFPSKATQEFSVAENERVEVRISNKNQLSGDLLRSNELAVDKRVGNEWVNLDRSMGGEFVNLNLLGKGFKSDLNGSTTSITYETPGDYRLTIIDESLLGLGRKEYTTTITRESFAGGFASSLITSDLTLSPRAKLLKVNGRELENEAYTAIPGKHGELLIGTDGRASYKQDQDATPSEQSETFTYEAREASGAIVESSFTITLTPPGVSGDLLSQDDASITSVGKTSLSENAEHTINGKFGDLKIKADGQYTYTPKLNLAGLNETDTFEYVVRHKNGETVTSTLNVHIADARLVAELEKVPLGSNSPADLTGTDAPSQHLLDVNNDDHASLPRLNLQEQKLDTSKLFKLQPMDDQSEAPLTVTLKDILQPDGTVSGSMSASVLDLPDSWKTDGFKASSDGRDYLHYIDTTTKKDLWVESGVSVI
ncbi:hypothetical protein BTN82_26210 [Pseudomonas chlororaphis]|uniref:Bacterial Ig domain-containing protein n=1 Tax=Pseudomonas chlororaphis TaxID=587753 RepID=A0A1Q8EK86_9PSED|nr:hypothetical protein BTN82_26210 [Pseudomonas chlororaphis]